MKTPRYLEMKHLLKERIRRGEYKVGDRLPSENELASQLGISRHTVLKGMAQLMAEGWIERYQGKGTFVARRSEGSPQGTRTVALICSDLSAPPILHIVAGVSGFLKDQRMELLLLDSDHSTAREAEHLDGLEDRGVVGALVWPHVPPANRDRVALLRDRGLPVVLLDRGFAGLPVPMVGVDNRAGAIEVVRHLIACGHRKIGHITVDQAGKHDVAPVADRERGYREAMAEAGLAVPEAYVQRVPVKFAEDAMVNDSLRELFAYETMHRLLNLPAPPDGHLPPQRHLRPKLPSRDRDAGAANPRRRRRRRFRQRLRGRGIPDPADQLCPAGARDRPFGRPTAQPHARRPCAGNPRQLASRKADRPPFHRVRPPVGWRKCVRGASNLSVARPDV